LTEKQEKPEKLYPIRSLHDFLSELDREWSKFRTGSLVGMIASGALLVFFITRLLFVAIRLRNFVDIIFMIVIAFFLVYSTYTLFVQYRFFSKWERRIGLLVHLEEKLISEKFEEKASK